jgi:hypothetical protein
MSHTDPPFDSYIGPFTIAYIYQHPDKIELRYEEYKTLEAVYAFITGRNLDVGDFVIVMGEKLNTTEGN